VDLHSSMNMNPFLKRILFALFFISGFCGLLYQVVWVRLAFASFGIITPVLSVIISVFMLGLACGSWAGGKWIGSLTRKLKISAIFFYAIAEFMIGLGAFIVPKLFTLGEAALLSAGESDSLRYLFFSANIIALSIFPWCVFMGTTFPFMMAFVKEVDRSSNQSFSFLYLANVIGAMFGTLVTAAVLIELLGFRHTLWVAGGFNLLIAAASVAIGLRSPRPKPFQGAIRESEAIKFPLREPVAGVE
jgi:spermidine synthase